MRTADAERGHRKSGPSASAHARSAGPLRSLELSCAGLAQMGVPAVARARCGQSCCRGHNSPSAQPGATICGVRAVALAPNSTADYLLHPRALSTGKMAEIRVRGARTTPLTRPSAHAAIPFVCWTDPPRAPPPYARLDRRIALHPHPSPVRRHRCSSREGRRRRRHGCRRRGR